MTEILLWMETSTLGQMMRDSTWLFPSAEILHFMGLSLLIGSLLVVDLRLLGLIKHVSLQAVYKFIPLSIVGFSINFSTGVLFCFTDPFRYYPNIAFRIKIILVLLAGLNAVWFKYAVYAESLLLKENEGAGKTAKTVAALSLVLWFSVIVLGRFMPYLEDVT